MPPYYFIVKAGEAERIQAHSPDGTARVYAVSESSEWMQDVTGDPTGDNVDPVTLDFLANELMDAGLNGGIPMSVDVDSREALRDLAVRSAVDILPFN